MLERCSVADRFGVGLAGVGGAEAEFRLGVDHHRFGVAADDVGAFVQRMAHRGEQRGGVGAHAVAIVADRVGLPLVVEAVVGE